MMKSVLFSLILLITTNISAQQLSTIGESNLKFYNKAIERLQKMSPGSMGYEELILEAENKVKAIKKSDPQYDVTALEEEVKKYKTNNSDAKDEIANNQKSNKEKDSELSDLLNWLPTKYKNSKTDSEFSDLENEINQKKAAINNFCKNNLNSNDKISMNKIEDNWEYQGKDQTILVSTKNNYEKSEGVEYAVYNFYQVQWIYNKWKAFSEVFSASSTIAEAKNEAEEVLNLLGSVESVKKQAIGTKEKRIADTKMEPSVVNDAQLESSIKTALLKSKFSADKTIVLIHIHSKEWGIQKNSVTGITISRTKGFSAGLKDKDGKCWLLHYVDYKQDYENGSFGQGYINLGELVEILCENVK